MSETVVTLATFVQHPGNLAEDTGAPALQVRGDLEALGEGPKDGKNEGKHGFEKPFAKDSKP